MKKLGIYIHVPFCRAKCLYCDFCSHPPRNGEKTEYVEALKRQIASYRERFCGYTADAVYFGGGTPTLLSSDQLGGILDALRASITVSEDAEITSECNPATVDRTALTKLRAAGINRLSIGAQSFNDDELCALGRLHNAANVTSTFDDARAAGFDNISLDLMYGIPRQTRDSWQATLDAAIALSPEHISAYGLRVEQGTPFGTMGDSLVLPDENLTAQMYLDATERLEQAGIYQYEISNFACRGRESRHNIKYWKCDEYVGFGVAAHSYFDGERYAAPTDIDSFVSGKFIDEQSVARVDEHEAEVEFVMLAMRLRDGLRCEEYRKRFGIDPAEKYTPRFAPYVVSGHVVADERGYRFTREGMLVSNYILSDVLDL
ncbi:MAG: radical SAM family heme chaperone HemW [Clostridia bacterium]|nr:radical SAM family heme chaperone HemW [Clostridia bacterium]